MTTMTTGKKLGILGLAGFVVFLCYMVFRNERLDINGSTSFAREFQALRTQVNDLQAQNRPNPAATSATAIREGISFHDGPDGHFRRILEGGGDGSIFYQMEASTRPTSENIAGPLGWSWRSTSEQALAESRRRTDGYVSGDTRIVRPLSPATAPTTRSAVTAR